MKKNILDLPPFLRYLGVEDGFTALKELNMRHKQSKTVY